MRAYIQQRIMCHLCKFTYDRRVIEPENVTICDHCGDPADLLFQCAGKTEHLPVPWVGKKFDSQMTWNGPAAAGRSKRRKKEYDVPTMDDFEFAEV